MKTDGRNPTVYIVIPVRDRWGLTGACLGSLAVQSYSSLRVVVVDDGSSDGTSTNIRAEFPDVDVLPGDGNLWWTGATALGIEWVMARAADSDLILTLNNDTTVRADYVETLVRVLHDHGGAAIVGSVAVDDCDHDTIVDGGAQVNWLTGKTYSENRGESLVRVLNRGTKSSSPSALPGRGTLIPVECIRRIGNFDSRRFPHYAADYEFSVRAQRSGYPLIMSYEAPVFSVVEGTGLSTRSGRLPWRRFVSMFFSRRSSACLLYRWRYARIAGPKWYWPVFLVADTVRLVGGGLRDQFGLGRVERMAGER